MLRRYQALWKTLFVASDLALSLGVFLLAYWIRFHPRVVEWLPLATPQPPFYAYLRIAPLLGLILLATHRSQRLYTPRREGSLGGEFLDLLRSTILATLLLTAVLFFDRTQSYARAVIAIFAVLNPLASFLFRAALRTALHQARRRGYNLRHVLVVGTGRTAQALIHRIRKNPWTGLRIAGLIGDVPVSAGRRIHGIEVVGTLDRLDEALALVQPDQVFIALPPREAERVEPLIRQLTERMIEVRIVPDLGVLLGLHRRTLDFDGLPIISLWESPISGWSAVLKRAMDVSLAFLALVVSSPLLLAIALAVKLTSRGPVFYRQERMGLDGRLFRMIKFRTMLDASEAEDGAWTRKGDPRCTTFGGFLRRTSLDELPQLLNVLLGHMSLVGPRPERPHHIETFKRRIPGYMLRHKVKAGITGWAQVNGWRGDTSLKKRIQYDLYYLRHWSMGFDLKIILLTIFRGLVHPNAY